MEKSYLPHNALFEEMQIIVTEMARDLPLVHSMLKWSQSTFDKDSASSHFGWMISKEFQITLNKKIEKLQRLQKGSKELKTPLKELMSHVLQFSENKEIEKALISFHNCYLTLPSIDNEMHLLCLGEDLFENRHLVEKLLLFTEKLLELQKSSNQLKQAILDTLLTKLTMHRFQKLDPTKKFST